MYSLRQKMGIRSAEIGKIESFNFMRFLETERPDASEMAFSNKLLHILYSKSISWEEHMEQNYNGDFEMIKIGNSSCFNVLITYFQNHKSEKRREFYEAMFCYEEYNPIYQRYGNV